jgi:preprotein translocase subunit SecB
MFEANKAAFSFVEFKIPKFSYDETHHLGNDIKIGFNPNGKYYTKTGVFELEISFIAYNEVENEKNPICDVVAVAKYKFDSPISIEAIPEYFYQNAIAIAFPYIRAFISTLTLQANTKLLKLGLMNLSKLEEPLKANTISID